MWERWCEFKIELLENCEGIYIKFIARYVKVIGAQILSS